jgi:hypothetical protein
MQHTNSHEKTSPRVGANGILANGILKAVATALEAKAEADQALGAAQQAQATAQAMKGPTKLFQSDLHKQQP